MSVDMLMVIGILLLGFVALAAEVFVLPGFGVAGVIGLVLLAVGVALAWYRMGPGWGVGSLIVAMVVTLVMAVIFPRTPMAKRLILRRSLAGPEAAGDKPFGRLGQTGTALTPLRPSGAIQVGDDRLDVVTDGEYIEPGAQVRVVAQEGTRLVVEPVDDA